MNLVEDKGGHLVYEKNKENKMIQHIIFPSIDRAETAKYIFEFINFLRLRNENNSIASFSKMEDIEIYLRKQWSWLFQRLLFEQRSKINEEKRMEFLANQIADIKTAIMTSISSSDLKETARGALKYRRLIEFISSLSDKNQEYISQDITWNELLKNLNIDKVFEIPNSNLGRNLTYILLNDGKIYEMKHPYRIFVDFGRQWEEFRISNMDSKNAIVNAILDDSTFRIRTLRPMNKEFNQEELDNIVKNEIIEIYIVEKIPSK